MKTLQEIVALCEGEAGKVFIMDGTGDVKLVLMGVGEYERLKQPEARNTKHETRSESHFVAPMQSLDPEAVNKEILIAQLREQAANFAPNQSPPRVQVNPLARQDLREEVIDPSFNFDSSEEDI